MLNFGIAMGITYGLAVALHFAHIDNDWIEWVADQGLSYVFGFSMSVMESFLVSIAVCSAGES